MGIFMENERRDCDEREVVPFYAGKIWKRSVKPIFDDFGDSLLCSVLIWSKGILYFGNCAFSVCLFQNVFEKQVQAQC